jgi:hypothetical protein
MKAALVYSRLSTRKKAKINKPTLFSRKIRKSVYKTECINSFHFRFVVFVRAHFISFSFDLDGKLFKNEIQFTINLLIVKMQLK